MTESTGEAAGLAAARSRAYQLFQQALRYPDAELCSWIANGDLADSLRECLATIEPKFAEQGERWVALRDAGEDDELAIEYTRLFDTGSSGPPCPLYGGLYGGARMKTMEEAVRFYNHFGLTLSEEQRELPDHLAMELEFLHYLTYREAETLQTGDDAGPYQRAQRDFIQRHPGSWIPKLCHRLKAEQAHPYFGALFGCLEDLLSWDAARLAGLS